MPALPGRLRRWLYAGIALVWCFIQFLPLYRGGYSYEVILLGTHVGAAVALAILSTDRSGHRRPDDAPLPAPELLLVLIPLGCALYFAAIGERIATRIAGVDAVHPLDYVFGLLLIGALLEACRRTTGLILTGVAAIFIAYVFVGPELPRLIGHSGMTLKRFVDLQVLSTNGVFGTPISASAHMVFYFVMVGAFLERSGAGKLFVAIAYSITGRSWGGAGKAAVVASGLFGTVSGSAVANVLLSGLMTIPLMKRSGFKAPLAGAIEATASTGGQLAPPIMGAAAFILADVVGVPYVEVVTAAIVPAILFYLSLLMLVHCHARRVGLAPDRSQSMAEHLAGLRERWHLLIPLVVMVTLLVSRYSLMTVGTYTIGVVIVVSLVRRVTAMGPRAIFDSLRAGTRAAAEVAVPSAVAGIIVGTLVHTGLALRLQQWLLAIAGDSLVISLVGAMVLTIILGMGMPTAAAYLVSAILVAPALADLGVQPLAAHLFILYFSILSMVTPPVALSAYAAAGISGANLWRTGVLAFLIAVPGFLIPYAFTINPALLLLGEPLEIAHVVLTTTLGVIAMASAGGGFCFGPLAPLPRVVMVAASPLMIAPDLTTDLAGGGVVAAIVVFQILRRHRFHAGRDVQVASGED